MKNKIIRNIMTVFQILLLIPPMLLQYLSYKKMGVMRYLVFKKKVFSEGMFNPSLVYIYKILLLLGIVISIVILLCNVRKKINNTLVRSLLGVILINSLATFCIFSNAFEKLLAYHFFLIVIFLIVALQYIKVILNNKKVKGY